MPKPDARLDVESPADLLRRLEYAAGLPAHQDYGGTFEALVVWALEEGLIGIVLNYERFEEKKSITDALHRDLVRPVCIGCSPRRRHGTPPATATATSSARNDLQHFGSPSTIACE